MIKKIFSVIHNTYQKLTKSPIQIARKQGVTIGLGCRIYGVSFGSEPWLISIGDNVTVTSGVKILTHDGATWLMRDEKGRRYSYKKTTIGNNVFIGVNSILMPGIIVEDNVIIAAGSIVTKSIPTGSIVGGNPAKIIGSYHSYRKKSLENFISEQEIDKNLPYQVRIEKVIDDQRKPFIQLSK